MMTAPIHWNQIVSHHDKFLRFNNAGGGVAGGLRPMSPVIEMQHSHAWNNLPHEHTIPAHVHTLDSRMATSGVPYLAGGVEPHFMAAGAEGSPDKRAYTGPEMPYFNPPFGYTAKPTTGAQQSVNSDTKSHTHALSTELSDVELAYLDVILCEKD